MLTYASIHEQGERIYQEDSFVACPGKRASAFWVADGLGGHGRGQDASQLVVKHCRENFSEKINADKYIDSVFSGGNEKLIEAQDRLLEKTSMKTTLVGCVMVEDELTWAHVGDSRMYLFCGNKIVTRTLDHSVPQVLVQTGEIEESEIRKHPDRNRVLRVLGDRDSELKYDRGTTVLLEEGMKVLLCTDGFWEWIPETDMERYLGKSDTVEEWLEVMKAHVKDAGQGKNMDNFTALSIWFLSLEEVLKETGKMALKLCQNGHYFDDTRDQECPWCRNEKAKDNFGAVDLNDQKTVSAYQLSSHQNDRNETIWLGQYGGGDTGLTVGMYSKVNGISWIAGWLVCVKGPEKGRDYRIFGGFNYLGRDPGQDISVPDDPAISRERHCGVVYDKKSNSFRLLALKGNLVYQNGEMIEQPVKLESGDRFTVGNSEFEFVAFCREGHQWEEE